MKRIKLYSKKPNPLFEIWLEEWRKEAAARNSDLQYHFSKALTSLKKYPLPLKCGKDCIILQHFGAKLCSMLDNKLEKYKAEKGALTYTDDLICLHCNYNEEHTIKKRCKSQKITSSKEYTYQRTEMAIFHEINLSTWSLENYAVLFTLSKNIQDPCYSGFITEVDLLLTSKELCGHTTEASIFKLVESGLVSMMDAPVRYNLTEHGVNIVKKICEVSMVDEELVNSFDVLRKIETLLNSLFTQTSVVAKNLNDGGINNQSSTSGENVRDIYNDLNKAPRVHKPQSTQLVAEKSKQQSVENGVNPKSTKNNVGLEKSQEKIINAKKVNKCGSNKTKHNKTDSTESLQKNIYLESNKFDIILLVDTQEISGGKTKPQHDATITELTQLGVLFEIRHLKVGDFTWIAKCRVTNNELILPYIVERKRIDDLSASITDGRFHEQKFRLKQSGIENLMYIIEQYDKGKRLAIPHASLMQASINTVIQDGFSVKYTKNHKDSMVYLSSLTRILSELFKEKNLIGCKKEAVVQMDIVNNTLGLMEFGEFNKAASKQKIFKVSQMFVRQLLQLKGMSVEKASACVECYPTPRILLDALQTSDCNGELLLSHIEFGDKKRSLGPTISKTIYQLYTRKDLN